MFVCICLYDMHGHAFSKQCWIFSESHTADRCGENQENVFPCAAEFLICLD